MKMPLYYCDTLVALNVRPGARLINISLQNRPCLPLTGNWSRTVKRSESFLVVHLDLFQIYWQDVEQMKKEKEVLDQQLRSMGINPPQGPSYLPTPSEMRTGPSLSFIGQDKDNMLSVRDRSLTTESYAGDLSEGMFVSTKDGPKTKPSIRIRSNSESEVPENKSNAQQPTRVRLILYLHFPFLSF